MSRASEGWYVAEPDGTTFGPMSREEMVGQKSRAAYSPEALAWHVDLSEWQPLARVAPPATHGAGVAAHAPQATPQTAAKLAAAAAAPGGEQRPSKAERKRMAKAAQAQREASGGGAGGDVDDGKRLWSHAPVPGGDLQAMAAAVMAASAKSSTSTPARAPGHLVTPESKPAVADEAARNAERFGLGARRLLARAIDWFTLGMLGGSLLWAVLASSGVSSEWLAQPNPYVLLVLGTFALVPLETLAIALAGTTPGKALLGLRVAGPGGGHPSLVRAWRRALAVAMRGMAFGLLFFTFFTVIVAIVRMMNKGTTSWDQNNELTVTAQPIPPGRWQAAAAAAILSFVALNGVFWPDFALQLLAAIGAWRAS